MVGHVLWYWRAGWKERIGRMWARVPLEPANLSPPTVHCLRARAPLTSVRRGKGKGRTSELRPGSWITLEHLQVGKGPRAPLVAGLGCQSLSSASRRSRKGPGCGCHTRHLPLRSPSSAALSCARPSGPSTRWRLGHSLSAEEQGCSRLWAPFLSGFSCWGRTIAEGVGS